VHNGIPPKVSANHIDLTYRVVSTLDTGVVAVNNWVSSVAEMPFGGVKYSGFGREGGADGIYEYLEAKFVNCNIRPY